jgi:predicted N-formylglutamate amidohydrolase
VLARHIGWDIGAAAVTRLLAERLGAPAVLSGYSRLVIDCNRTLDDPTSILTISDGHVVPSNQELSAEHKRARAEACFWPYHRAVEAQLERALALGTAPAVISIHSFTPQMPRLPVPLLAGLAARDGLVVGDNEPYSGHDPEGFTLRHHAMPRGLPHVLIELRQDEIATAEGAERFAAHLDAALAPILADPLLYRPAIYL